MLRIFTLITLLFANTSFAQTDLSTELRFRCEIKKLEIFGFDTDLRRVKVGNIVPVTILLETNADKKRPQASVKLATKTIKMSSAEWTNPFFDSEILYQKKDSWLSASIMASGFSGLKLSPNFLQIANSSIGAEVVQIQPNLNNFTVKFAETFQYELEAECPEPMPKFELLKATIAFEEFFQNLGLIVVQFK